MTTHPLPTDPVSALSRNDGTAGAHSEDHSKVIDTPVNAKKYLRGDGVEESDAALTAFETACAGKAGYVPPGTYVMPDGRRFFKVANNTTIRGAGGATIIETEDAYAFTGPTSGPTTHVRVEGFATRLRAGSVTGGAMKFRSTDYNAHFIVRDITAEGVTTALDPIVWVDGYISSTLHKVNVSTCGGDGIFVDSTGFTSNLWRVEDCTVSLAGVASITSAGIRVNGGEGGFIGAGTNCEGNRCFGIVAASVSDLTIRDAWAEANWNNDLVINVASFNVRVLNNHFTYFTTGHGVDADLRHILIEESGVPTLRHTHQIIGNQFAANATPSGTKVEIEANTFGCTIAGNRGIAPGWENEGSLGTAQTIVDDAANLTTYYGNDSSVPGGIFPVNASRIGGVGISTPGGAQPMWAGGTGAPVHAAEPGTFYTQTDGDPGAVLWVKGSQTSDLGWMNIGGMRPPTIYSDAATITADCNDSETFAVNMTVARTVALPLNTANGQRATFLVCANSGSPITPIWNAKFRLGGAFEVAAGKRRAISFMWWSAADSWVELSRTGDYDQ